MKTKTLLIAAAILLAVFAIWELVDRPGKESIYDESAARASTQMFPDYKADNVTRLELAQSGMTTALVKEDGVWKVESAGGDLADQKQVENIVGQVPNLNYDDLKSTNKDKHGNYEVDDLKGVRVKFLYGDGSTAADFYVGKPLNDFVRSYVRKADDDNVYTAENMQRFVFAKDNDTWRDRSIVRFEKDKAQRVTWTAVDGGRTSIAKDAAGQWALEEPEARPIDPKQADELMETLSDFRASSFEKQEDASTGFATETLEIKVEIEGADPQTARVGHMKSKFQTYVQKPGRDAVFVVSQTTIDNIVKTAADFSPYEPPAEEAPAAPGDASEGGAMSEPPAASESSEGEPVMNDSEAPSDMNQSE